jgi:hypothetical protein
MRCAKCAWPNLQVGFGILRTLECFKGRKCPFRAKLSFGTIVTDEWQSLGVSIITKMVVSAVAEISCSDLGQHVVSENWTTPAVIHDLIANPLAAVRM